MFSLFDKLSFGQSSRMTSAVVGLSLAAVGTSIYLSPIAPHHKVVSEQASLQRLQSVVPPVTGQSPVRTRALSGTATVGATAHRTRTGAGTRNPVHAAGLRVVHAPGRTEIVVVHAAGRTVTHTVTRTKKVPVVTVRPSARRKHCADFRWQQDAQAAYLANLTDPGALDGAIGAHNGDGIACNSLPADPARPASVAVDPYVAPTPSPATKAALLTPTSKYFGIAQDGVPGDTSMLDRLAVQAGKAPSSVEWFSGFDENYPAGKVNAAWLRGALPVITWMSVAADKASGHDSSEYTLSRIVDGDVDNYLYKYAGDVVRAGLPVAIRFDHEMNGNSYPWSAGMYSNTPARYVAAWQHVWNIFEQVGANANTIWIWAPTRIDLLKPHAKVGNGVGQTDLAEDYPGDKYVDWLGASIYLRSAKTGDSYDATFGKTVRALESLCGKPLFIAETSAAQNDVNTRADLSDLKAQWTANALAGFLADPRIVGFIWFNNQGLQSINGTPVTNDWRFDSSAPALTSFQQAIADSRFSGGVLPDGL
jgi:mannan endo-1,4-beta-mannosidase